LYTRAAGNSSHALTTFNNLRKFGFLALDSTAPF
jgi:hypothetical protein